MTGYLKWVVRFCIALLLYLLCPPINGRQNYSSLHTSHLLLCYLRFSLKSKRVSTDKPSKDGPTVRKPHDRWTPRKKRVDEHLDFWSCFKAHRRTWLANIHRVVLLNMLNSYPVSFVKKYEFYFCVARNYSDIWWRIFNSRVALPCFWQEILK